MGHLTDEQLKQLDSITMVSKEKFDELWSAYTGSSLSRHYKGIVRYYLWKSFADFAAAETTSDRVVSDVNRVMERFSTDQERFVGIAETLRTYISTEQHYRERGFCRYLVDNLNTLVGESRTLERKFESYFLQAVRSMFR